MVNSFSWPWGLKLQTPVSTTFIFPSDRVFLYGMSQFTWNKKIRKKYLSTGLDIFFYLRIWKIFQLPSEHFGSFFADGQKIVLYLSYNSYSHTILCFLATLIVFLNVGILEFQIVLGSWHSLKNEVSTWNSDSHFTMIWWLDWRGGF